MKKYTGYNIKYIQKPGNKTKTPMYEIAPGHWVTRGNLPETKNRKKSYRAIPENLARERKLFRDYWQKNRDSLLKKRRKYVKENKGHVKQRGDNWNSTEYGYIMNLYSSAKKDALKGRRGGEPFAFEFTKKSWWEHWRKQKLTYGMMCPYSVTMDEPIKMTHIRGKGTIPTNISRDQIWPGLGYTKFNLIFCSSNFNTRKGAISPLGCWAIIQLYQQRYTEYEIDKATGGDNFYGSDFHRKAIREHYINALPKKYRMNILNLTYLQSQLEKAKENNDLVGVKTFELKIKNFYEKK